MARLVYYALGGGLGHLNRGLAVVRHLRRLAPHSEALLITSSPFCHLAVAQGVPTLRLPTTYEQQLLGDVGIGARLARAMLDAVAPMDALVVDAVASALTPEVLEVVERGRFFRGFLHREENIETYDDRLELFDRVFYPFPVAPSDVGLPDRLQAVGYVLSRSSQDVLTRTQARLRLGLAPDGEEPLVLAYHAGSPAETMALFRRVKAASDRLAEGEHGVGHALRLVTPQILPGAEFFYPHLLAIHPVMDVLEAADLVVCAAGYSSVAELACLGRRAILWPLDRVGDDQAGRIGHWPAIGAVTSEEELAELMREQLAQADHPPRAAAVDYRGAEIVAEALASVASRT